MGLFAFDLDLQTIVEAQCAVKKPRGHYLCPDIRCRGMKVPVFLVETDYGKHFSSYDVSLHHENCDFVSSYSAKYRNKPITEFSPQNLLLNLLKDSIITVTEHKPSTHIIKDSYNHLSLTTLRKLYCVCMSNDLNFRLNDDYTVDDICVSARNANSWRIRKWDNKILLVVGTVYHVDWKKHSVTMEVAEKLKIVFEFEFTEHYNQFYSNLKQFSNLSNVKVAVYGAFRKQSYSFLKGEEMISYQRNTTKIKALGQVKILSRCKSSKAP